MSVSPSQGNTQPDDKIPREEKKPNQMFPTDTGLT